MPESDTPQPESSRSDGTAPAPNPSSTPGSLPEWKQILRHKLEHWLTHLDDEPDFLPEPDLEPEPDLYSFFEALTALSAESRKANRRAAEAFSQWNLVLENFQGRLEEMARQSAASSEPEEEGIPRELCLALIEIMDRIQRLAEAFRRPPQRTVRFFDRTWSKAWDTQGQALDILCDHFHTLLKRTEIRRLPCVGKPFDPTAMAVVQIEADPSRPHHTVLEELAPGYRRHGEILRVAQVKISVRPSCDDPHEVDSNP